MFQPAIVTNSSDPLGQRRARLSIPQVLGPVESGWASPLIEGELPSPGDRVWVTFEGGQQDRILYLPLGVKPADHEHPDVSPPEHDHPYSLLTHDHPYAPLPGDLKMTARVVPAPGWLLANGAAVSRTTYSALFNAIGVAFGVGNGSTTFNLPDFRDRFPVGAGGSIALGNTGGSSAVMLTQAQMPAHVHPGPSHTHAPGTFTPASSAGSHAHSIDSKRLTVNQDHSHDTSATRVARGATGTANGTHVNETITGVVNSDGAHTHNITGASAASGTANTGSTGSGGSVENRPPYLAAFVHIKT